LYQQGSPASKQQYPFTSITAADAIVSWEMEDLTDSTGNGHTITNSGATSGSTGIIGNCYDFDGTNDYMTIADATAFDQTTKWSMSTWVKTDVNGVYQGIIGKWNYVGGGSGSGSWALQIYNVDDTLQFFITDSIETTGNQARSDSGLSTGTWYHVCIAYDGDGVGNAGRVQMYLNGVLQTTYVGTIPATMYNSTAGISVGRFEGLGRYFNGLIDETLLFDVTLTADQALYLYNAGAPGSEQQYPF
jgi:hypothetical protein